MALFWGRQLATCCGCSLWLPSLDPLLLLNCSFYDYRDHFPPFVVIFPLARGHPLHHISTQKFVTSLANKNNILFQLLWIITVLRLFGEGACHHISGKFPHFMVILKPTVILIINKEGRGAFSGAEGETPHRDAAFSWTECQSSHGDAPLPGAEVNTAKGEGSLSRAEIALFLPCISHKMYVVLLENSRTISPRCNGRVLMVTWVTVTSSHGKTFPIPKTFPYTVTIRIVNRKICVNIA